MKTPLPEGVHPGMFVGGYRVARQLGAGGFGQVYLAQREGAACALKFLHLERVGDWGWRELLILMSHDLPHVVKLRSHFKWPESKPEYLVLVMEYVPGVTLFEWARGHNPCAREVVGKLLPLARALGGVHAAGVLHRDLKGDNVLIHEGDGQPVLVDFGAGTHPHAPPVTREGLAPANLRYRAPESVAFFLRPVREPGERYEYGVKDEMYALGVILYVLTTDGYPFDGADDDLMDEILAGEPAPPCEVDSRVPVPLSDLCLRLLAMEPSVRVPDAGALCEALEALLAHSKGDARWEVPLCYGWTEEGRTTERVLEPGGDSTQARLRRWMRQKPKRGPPPRPAPRLEPAAAHQVPTGHARRRRLTLGLWITLGLVVVGVGLSQLLGPPAPAPRVLTPVLPADSLLTSPPPWAVSVHEVAPPGKPPEADPGAAPVRADTPAPVTAVTLRKDTPRMKKKVLGSQLLLAMTAAANVACPGPQVRGDSEPPVRQNPAPQACPPGAVETMRSLGLPMGQHYSVQLPGMVNNQNIPVVVQSGPIVPITGANWHAGDYDPADHTPDGPTVFPVDVTQLAGQLYVGDKRVYVRLTQATLPGGETFPICAELYDADDCRGLEIRSVERAGVVKVKPRPIARPVNHFE